LNLKRILNFFGSSPHTQGSCPLENESRFGSVHPRTNGENVTKAPRLKREGGSPPHTQGKRYRNIVSFLTNQFTPADAGRSERHAKALVHPRTNRENWALIGFLYGTGGSPLQVREKHCKPQNTERDRRFTPACAGKTLPSSFASIVKPGSPPHTQGKLHPLPRHARQNRFTPAGTCRENALAPGKDGHIFGSPPHTQGKPVIGNFWDDHDRFTPAHAGKTRIHDARETPRRFTPAHAGKTLENRVVTGIQVGSPPHTQGKYVFCPIPSDRARFTPASAGKTKRIVFGALVLSVHPRKQRENLALGLSRRSMVDSPPYTQGKLRLFDNESQFKTVHPRTRRENTATVELERFSSGSPPQARGN
jgi:hypothetical protein